MGMVINIDEALADADWLRARRWDVMGPNYRPAQTVADLRSVGYTDATMRKLLTLPAGRAMPAKLRAEIEAL